MTPTTIQSVTAIHKQTTQLKIPDVARYLLDHLGPTMSAALAKKSLQTVRRYANAQTAVPEDVEKRLRDAHMIFTYIEQVDSPQTVRAWFMGMNPQLNDQSPIEVLINGYPNDVLAAAKAFVTGG